MVEMSKREIKHKLLHTGQHYDVNMSQVFINELKLPKPNVNINIGSGASARTITIGNDASTKVRGDQNC